MKVFFVVVLAVLLVGCAKMKTLEELEFAALESGDWSAVEQREKKIERRKRQRGVTCGSGLIALCEKRVRGMNCQCQSRREIDDLLGRL